MTTPERFRARLGQALVAHATELVAHPVARTPARPRWRVSLARLVPGATLAGLIVCAVLWLSSGSGSPPEASAASVLRMSAAALERSTPSLALGAKNYLYTRTLVWWRYFNQPGRLVVRSIDEIWVGRSGAGRTRERVLNPSSATRPFSHDLRLPRSAHPFLLDPYVQLSYAQLQRLPADPPHLAAAVGQLADREARRYGGSLPHGAHTALMFSILHGIAVSPAPASVRAAVYRVMARTPGIRLLGPGRDVLRRAGMVFVATLDPFRFELIIDPASGSLLQWSRTVLHRSRLAPGWQPGLVNRATYQALAVVPSTRSRPR